MNPDRVAAIEQHGGSATYFIWFRDGVLTIDIKCAIEILSIVQIGLSWSVRLIK